MPNQKTAKPDQGLTRVGDRLFEALTQQEIARLLDAVFAVLSPELLKPRHGCIHPFPLKHVSCFVQRAQFG